jgi:hypothetical protein
MFSFTAGHGERPPLYVDPVTGQPAGSGERL